MLWVAARAIIMIWVAISVMARATIKPSLAWPLLLMHLWDMDNDDRSGGGAEQAVLHYSKPWTPPGIFEVHVDD